jgi:hypothetical protein
MAIAQRPWVARRGEAALRPARSGACAVQRYLPLRWLMHLVILLGLLGLVVSSGL